jgi:hypothetical protein
MGNTANLTRDFFGHWHRIAGAVALAGLSACSTVDTGHLTRSELLALSASNIRSPITTETAKADIRLQAAALIARVDAAQGGQEELFAALHAVAFHEMEPAAGRRILHRALKAQSLSQLDAKAQRELLTHAHTLDAQGSAPLVAPQLGSIATPREFAIAAQVLLTAGGDYPNLVAQQLAARPDKNDPRLVQLARLMEPREVTPPLSDLLGAPFRLGLPVVFSIQRQDRRHLGRLLLRGADGRFVRDASGQPFSRPHLAMALNNLPGTITNGNTPQGVFTIVGAAYAWNNPWIGPTPFLHSKLPIEASVAEFQHDTDAGPWREDLYLAMLPLSWRAYKPMQDAWLAGKAGRDQLLLHGTTKDAASYKGRTWYPGTPTSGCMVALEDWHPGDGALLRSDQLDLVQAFARQSPGGVPAGYLVVVELDARASAVQLSELLGAIEAAEAAVR